MSWHLPSGSLAYSEYRPSYPFYSAKIGELHTEREHPNPQVGWPWTICKKDDQEESYTVREISSAEEDAAVNWAPGIHSPGDCLI